MMETKSERQAERERERVREREREREREKEPINPYQELGHPPNFTNSSEDIFEW